MDLRRRVLMVLFETTRKIVNVWALLTETGQPLLTEDGEELEVEHA